MWTLNTDGLSVPEIEAKVDFFLSDVFQMSWIPLTLKTWTFPWDVSDPDVPGVEMAFCSDSLETPGC